MKENIFVKFVKMFSFSLFQIILCFLVYWAIFIGISICLSPGIFSGGISDIENIIIHFIAIGIISMISIKFNIINKNNKYYSLLFFAFLLLLYYIPNLIYLYSDWVQNVTSMGFIEYFTWVQGDLLKVNIGIGIGIFVGYISCILINKSQNNNIT